MQQKKKRQLYIVRFYDYTVLAFLISSPGCLLAHVKEECRGIFFSLSLKNVVTNASKKYNCVAQTLLSTYLVQLFYHLSSKYFKY
jgi:hypothetical protein